MFNMIQSSASLAWQQQRRLRQQQYLCMAMSKLLA
jgi:hypothetical protein